MEKDKPPLKFLRTYDIIKYTVPLINMLALYMPAVFFAAPIAMGVNVKTDAPSQVKQGEEFTVSLTVNKGSIAGIGYMMQTLPVGFGNAAVVGAKNGSEFKYMPEGNTIKFIWIALPADREFTVSYKVKVNTDAPTGHVTLAGKFSYVLDNRKETFIIPDVSITVSGAGLSKTEEEMIAKEKQLAEERAKAEAERKSMEAKAVKAKAEADAKLKAENREKNIFRDFKDENNQSAQPGFYVTVGSFLNRNYARAEVKRLINKGYKAADWLYLESTKFHYVFIRRANTKEEALKLITNAKAAGYEDVWIQRIVP